MKVKLDLSKFELKDRDDKIATMIHPDGHEVRIAIKALHPENRKNLDGLKMAQGGKVKDKSNMDKFADSTREAFGEEPASEPSKPKKESDKEALANGMKKAFGYKDGGEVKKSKGPYIDPQAAKEVEAGATDSGWRPQEWKKNLKAGLGLAQGGEVSDDEIMRDKKATDDYNNLHEDEPKEYSQQVTKRMRETDVTPRKFYDGGEAIASDPSQVQMAIASDPSQVRMPEELSQQPGMIPQQGMPVEPAARLAPQSQGLAQVPPPGTPVTAQQASPDAMSQLPGYDMQSTGIANQAMAQERLAKDSAAIAKGQMAAQAQAKLDYDQHLKSINDERAAIQEDIKNTHIDPTRYLGSQTTGQKIMTGIGLVLGGFGGGGQGNQALDFLNKQIEHDIDAQKAELGKKETLLSANMKQYQNLEEATKMTHIMMTDMAMSQLQLAQARATGLTAKGNAQALIGQLEAQQAPMIQQLAIRRTLASNEKATQGQDPTVFVPHVVPKEHQEAVYKEIARAQDTKGVTQSALGNFDKVASKMNAVSGLGRIGTAIYTPAEQQALEAELGSTVGDKEGTVRETAMHNVKNAYLPRITDSPERLAQRRDELAKYLKLQSAAPRAKSFGIDLDKFDSTTRNQPETRTFNGAQYQKVQGGWKKI